MKKTSILLIILLGTGLSVFAQNSKWEEITREQITAEFKKIRNRYMNTQNYSLKVKHSLYKDHTQKTPEDQSYGYFIKKGENYHSFIMGTHTIQNDMCKIVLDTSLKLILVNHADKENLWNTLPVDPVKSFTLVSSIKSYTGDKVKKFRIDYELESGISSCEVHVNDENLPVKLILCYQRSFSRHSFVENSPPKNPRVEIEFTDYRVNENMNIIGNEFDDGEYFISTSDKLIPSENYRGYIIRDMRVKVNQ